GEQLRDRLAVEARNAGALELQRADRTGRAGRKTRRAEVDIELQREHVSCKDARVARSGRVRGITAKDARRASGGQEVPDRVRARELRRMTRSDGNADLEPVRVHAREMALEERARVAVGRIRVPTSLRVAAELERRADFDRDATEEPDRRWVVGAVPEDLERSRLIRRGRPLEVARGWQWGRTLSR